MDLNGNHLSQLVSSSTSDWNPTWSPDGSKIAFLRLGAHEFEVWVVNVDGTGATRLTNSGAQPDWSPDGHHILYMRDYDIWIMNADGPVVTLDAELARSIEGIDALR
jgi:Tol biopolymer transport system component